MVAVLKNHVCGTISVSGWNSGTATSTQNPSYDYQAFGETYAPGISVEVEQRYTYTGRELNGTSGTMYYRYRFYEAGVGRFVGRGPIGYDGGVNIYGYVGNRPQYYIDPSGKLSVKVLKTNLTKDGAGCGDVHSIEWDFLLDKPAPCDGYIVLRNEVRQQVSEDCKNCVAFTPLNPTFTYFEAWWVKKGDTKQSLRNAADWRGGQRVGPTTYTDRAAYPVKNNTCGSHVQLSTIKFFCKDANDQGSGGIGTGDIGRENEASGVVGSAWRPGGEPMAGWLPSFRVGKDKPEPDWWGKVPVEGPATRSFSVGWCCCGEKTWALSFGDPQ